MSEIKWIKIVTDIFDDEKILLIESLPEADSIIVIWFKLLCLAGKQNNSGVFVMGNGIPYTEPMLSTIFRRKDATVKLALKTFEQFGMIEVINGAVTIPNWGKHQSIDMISDRRDYMRDYMQKYRCKQQMLTGKANGKVNVNLQEGEVERDIDIVPNGTCENSTDFSPQDPPLDPPERETIDWQAYMDTYHRACPRLSPIRDMTEKRKRTMRVWIKKGLSLEKWKVYCKLINSIDFLCGENKNAWAANFDWIIKPENRQKVIEGTYKNR